VAVLRNFKMVNFKLTLWKAAVSSLVAVLAGLYLSFSFGIVCFRIYNNPFCLEKMMIFFIVFVSVSIFIYVIWSLFEKK